MNQIWGTIPAGERTYTVCSNPGPDVCLLSLEVRGPEGRQLPFADIELAILAVAVGIVARADDFRTSNGQITPQPNLLIVPTELTACDGFIHRVEVLLNATKHELERVVRAQRME
jgi:hypothetical protein